MEQTLLTHPGAYELTNICATGLWLQQKAGQKWLSQ